MDIFQRIFGLDKKSRSSLLILGLLLMVYIYTVWYPEIIRYKDFGIRVPSGYTVHGIDVSRYQGDISWEEVEKMKSHGMRINFAIMKATEGVSITDPKFHQNWRKIKRTNITRGAYHFFRSNIDPLAQAKHFLRKVKFKDGDFYPVLDIETEDGMSNEVIRKRAKVFLDYVKRRTGVTPIIYSNVSFRSTILNTAYFDQFPYWAAHYNSSNSPRISKEWMMWQFSESGTVNSIKNDVDFNVFNGTLEELSDYSF